MLAVINKEFFFHPKCADPDQTAPLGLYTVCPDLSFRKLMTITVLLKNQIKLIFPEYRSIEGKRQ